MSYPWTPYKTWVTGEVLTAGDLNTSFSTVVTNADPTSTNDYSANVTQMQSTTDPYPAAAESLATTLAGELERLRYVMAQVTGEAQWYIDPAVTLTNIKNGVTTFAGAKTFSTAVAITATSNHLALSTASNSLTISAASQATSSRTWTIPDVSGNGTFAALEGAQTFSGLKTFSSTLTESTATSDGTTYTPLSLSSGGGTAANAGEDLLQSTTGVTSTGSTILTTTEDAYLVEVCGNDSTNFFADLLWYTFNNAGGAPTVLSSRNYIASPAVRTYSLPSNSVLKLTMASGTYSVRVRAIGLGRR